MKITYKGDYALKAVLDLALHYNQGVVRICELAKRTDVPVKFLEQVLLDLKRGDFVESKRGVAGGYFLAKGPREIKLGDVIRFIDGPLEPIECAGLKDNYKGCVEVYKCVFKPIWRDVFQAISGVVDNITFEDIVKQLCDNKKAADFQI